MRRLGDRIGAGGRRRRGRIVAEGTPERSPKKKTATGIALQDSRPIDAQIITASQTMAVLTYHPIENAQQNNLKKVLT